MLRKKIADKGLNGNSIGRLLSKKLGKGDPRVFGTQIMAFLKGTRPLSKKLIPGFAEILEVREDLVRELGDKTARSELVLSFDQKLKFREFLESVPEEYDTMDKFLVWLSTEIERRDALSRLS